MKDKKPKKILNIIMTIVLAISGLFVSIGVIQKVTNKTIIPYSIVWVLTESMEGTNEDSIPAESYIIVKKYDEDKLKEILEEGDIITFYSRDPSIEGQLNTHRIYEIDGDLITTKGDNNSTTDEYKVYYEDIVGVYVKQLPVLTKLTRGFLTPAGLALVLVFFSFLFIIWTLQIKKKNTKEYQIKEAIKKEIKKLEEENMKGKE